LRVGIVIASVLTPVQIMVGDLHGLNTLEHQAGEDCRHRRHLGNRAWRAASAGSPCRTGKSGTTTSRSPSPRGASLILTHELDGELKGPEPSSA